MKIFLMVAIITLFLDLVLCGDNRLEHYKVARAQLRKQESRNAKEENEAIKRKLDEYFATVHPIDLKYGITTEKANQIDTLYKVGDKNLDGKLTLDEMRELVDAKHVMTESELQELLKTADTNNDGSISADELAAYIARTELTMENVNADFNRDKARLMDLNKDGFIEMEEFQRMYRFCNQNFNRQLIQMIIQVGDQNNDKQLSYNELGSVLKSKDVLTVNGEENPQEKAFKRIRFCMEKFIEKCKNGFCNRPLKKTRASLTELIKLPFISWGG